MLQAYKHDVNAGRLKPESKQEACVTRLDAVLGDLDALQSSAKSYNSELKSYLDKRKQALGDITRQDQLEARRREESCKRLIMAARYLPLR